MNKKYFLYFALFLVIFFGGKPFEGYFVQLKIIESYHTFIVHRIEDLVKHPLEL